MFGCKSSSCLLTIQRSPEKTDQRYAKTKHVDNVSQRQTTNVPHSQSRSVYVHVPFCAHRCGYCNFALITGRDDLVQRYIEALAIEVEQIPEPQTIDTMFWGGGTPSHLSGSQIEKLFAILSNKFKFADGFEFSIEINPNDMNAERAQAMQEIGVNRASFGVQSFNPSKLKFLERTHHVEHISRAIEFARTFATSISIDLIFGTAGETLADWRAELTQTVDLAPEHVSTYGLTIEKGTQFWNRQMHGQTLTVSDDQSADMYEMTIDTFSEAGLLQYEISSFAQTGHQCRHNQVYWNAVPYLAFGPGAASFDGVTRRRNHQSVTTYIKCMFQNGAAIDQTETLDRQTRWRERLIFALRQTRGLNIDQFVAETRVTPDELVGSQKLESLIDNGLLEISDGYLRLTRRGLLVSDSIFVELL